MGKSLQNWLKEFGTLVFTQTIQAFIYAIIVSIVTISMVQTEGVTSGNQNAAIGFVSVIALTSVFKVEEMLRKIIGLGTSKASVKGAMGSIAKTAVAFQMGKRVMDNTSKVTKGVGQRVKGRADMKKANAKGEANKKSTEAAEARAHESFAQKEKEIRAKYGESDNPRVPLRNQEAKALLEQAKMKKEDNLASVKERYQTLKEENKAKVEEIKKSRREGTKMMASGSAEFVGSVFGGTTGAIIGGADGNLGEAAQGLMAGAGVGDKIGESMVDTVASSVETATAVKKYSKKYLEDLEKGYKSNRDDGNSRKYALKKSFTDKLDKDLYHSNLRKMKERIRDLDGKIDHMDM